MYSELLNINLKYRHTFGMDVYCSRWLSFTAAEDLYAIFPDSEPFDYKIIGEGSNLLFKGDYQGTLIHPEILDFECECLEDGKVRLHVGAGMVFDDLVAKTTSGGYWGIENLSGIPGQVGAAAVQNIGAYGVEFCDVVEVVYCFDTKTRKFVMFNRSECDYAYRHSRFKSGDDKGRYVVTHVDIILGTAPAPKLEYGNLQSKVADIDNLTPAIIRDIVLSVRDSKLPSPEKSGSAGSFFMNPIVSKETFDHVCAVAKAEHGEDYKVPYYPAGDMIKIPAAWLIDQCGWKGIRQGNVAVWDKQPLVLVNATGNATYREINELYTAIQSDINKKFNISLRMEVEEI